MSYKRVFVIVMDSVGTGAAHDAAKFDDVGSDTLGHVGEYYKGALKLPNLSKLGISNLRDTPIEGVPVADPAIGDYGKMEEISAGIAATYGKYGSVFTSNEAIVNVP